MIIQYSLTADNLPVWCELEPLCDMLRPPEEHTLISNMSIFRDQRSIAESISNNMHEHKYKERKWETNNFTRFEKIPTSSGQKGKDLIQATELQELQIDLKIQIENLCNSL